MKVHRWWSPPGRNGPPEAQECNTRKGVTNWMDPPKRRICYPERSQFLTSEGSDQRGLYQILPARLSGTISSGGRPDRPGLRMTVNHGWRPPGRNGPVGTSPPTCDRLPSGFGNLPKAWRGLTISFGRFTDGSSLPKKRNRHPYADLSAEGSDQRDVCQPDADLTAEGSDNCMILQILRPDKSGLRMTAYDVVKKQEIEKYSADEKQCSVLELCEEKKFSRGKCFGTPSFSLTANQTDDLFTMNTFS
jgi:hypothetical protein